MTRRHTLAIIFGTLLTALPAHAATSVDGDELTDAVTAPMEERKLAFTVPGMAEQILIKEGDTVKKGQILIKLVAKEQEARLKQLEHQKINSDKKIEAATKTSELAHVEYKKYEQVFSDDAGSSFEYERSKIQWELRKIELELEKHNKQQVVLEIASTNAILSRYSLRAPIDGRIEMVEVSEGETVQQLRPVVALVMTNPLKIEAAVDTRLVNKLKIRKDQPAWIISANEDFTEPMAGTVTFMAEVADPASETRRVTIEVPNDKKVIAGISVMVTFKDPAQMASTETTR